MVLTKSLILKGIIGAASIVLPTSLVIAYKNEISSYFNPPNWTKFDQGLIDYIDAGGDIQFKVTKGDQGGSDLQDSDLVLSGTDEVSVVAKISIGTNGSEGTFSDSNNNQKGKTSELKKINKSNNDSNEGVDWTWICEIQFKRKGNEGTNIKTTYKDRIFKGSNEGLFGILKNSSNSDEKKKETKKNFIKNCAKVRKDNKTFKIGSNNEVKTSKDKIVFEFQKESGGENLIPQKEAKFNKWFPITT